MFVWCLYKKSSNIYQTNNQTNLSAVSTWFLTPFPHPPSGVVWTRTYGVSCWQEAWPWRTHTLTPPPSGLATRRGARLSVHQDSPVLRASWNVSCFSFEIIVFFRIRTEFFIYLLNCNEDINIHYHISSVSIGNLLLHISLIFSLKCF